jgi:hypothetical protein
MRVTRCNFIAVTARFYRCNTTVDQNQGLFSENAVKQSSYSDLTAQSQQSLSDPVALDIDLSAIDVFAEWH